MTSRERVYLLDVLLRAEDALSYVAGRTFEDFERGSLLRDAVLHCLANIGEAAREIVTVELPKVVATLDPLFPERKSR